jgi:hypothetical protein
MRSVHGLAHDRRPSADGGGDAVNAKKASGQAKETLEVIDVAQPLVRSVRERVPRDQEFESRDRSKQW